MHGLPCGSPSGMPQTWTTHSSIFSPLGCFWKMRHFSLPSAVVTNCIPARVGQGHTMGVVVFQVPAVTHKTFAFGGLPPVAFSLSVLSSMSPTFWA